MPSVLLAALLLAMAGCGSGSSATTTTSSTSEAATAKAPVARGVKRVRVPDLIGERFGRAVQAVKNAGLRQEAPHFTGTVGNPHYSGHCQKVLNQSPPAGARVPEGFTVAIVYGVCPRNIAHRHNAMKPPSNRGNG